MHSRSLPLKAVLGRFVSVDRSRVVCTVQEPGADGKGCKVAAKATGEGKKCLASSGDLLDAKPSGCYVQGVCQRPKADEERCGAIDCRTAELIVAIDSPLPAKARNLFVWN